MTDWFVFEAIGVLDRPVFSDDQHVLGRQMSTDAAFPHRLRLFFETEGPGGGEFSHVILSRSVPVQDLSLDSSAHRVVVEVEHHPHPGVLALLMLLEFA